MARQCLFRPRHLERRDAVCRRRCRRDHRPRPTTIRRRWAFSRSTTSRTPISPGAYRAGVAWCFAPRWLVDFSYRRLNLGEVTFNPLLANELILKDLTANEFRIGLRYNFD